MLTETQFLEKYQNHYLNPELIELMTQHLGAFYARKFHQTLLESVEHGEIVPGTAIYWFFNNTLNQNNDNLTHIGEKNQTLRDFVAHGYNSDDVYFRHAFAINNAPLTLDEYLHPSNNFLNN